MVLRATTLLICGPGYHRYTRRGGHMAISMEEAMPSYALTRLLLTHMEYFPRIVAVTVHRTDDNDAYKGIEAFLAMVQGISATGSFFWRPETAQIAASEQVYHLFDLDP